MSEIEIGPGCCGICGDGESGMHLAELADKANGFVAFGWACNKCMMAFARALCKTTGSPKVRAYK